ncbi:MAG TPA: hypothetical protein VFP98_05580, partial [Candidatus Polarisedimenticolia bacterium]|nr:hypothetical protein [Candidatus Polarisedimenticolia bacterium]
MIRGRRAWRAGLALTALQALAWEASEAKLPSWAQEVADAAPPIPERFIEDRSRVLYSFMRYEIRPDGSVEMLKRLAVQALQAYPVDTRTGAFRFRPTMRVKASRAWHLRPDARSMRSYLPPIDLLVDTAFLGDTKVKIKPVEGTRKGSIVFFEFEAVDKPYFLSITHMFYEGAPMVRARLEVAAPPGWLVRSSWLRLQGPDPVVDGGAHVWELRDLQATRSEPLGPHPADRAPFLAVQVAPPEGVVTEPATFRDWTAVSEWYEGMVAGRHEASPAVERAATQHMPESSAGFYERVLAAARYVRDSVRYVAIELGLGGWRPHAASETLANLYGDCKDKGTLFRSLLAVRGIPSYPVLINLSIPDLVSRDVPVVAFNHFVVAVPVPDDAELPASLAPAVVDAGDLGRLLFVDTTDEDTSIGYISGELAGQLGLVVAGPHGRLVRLPDERPESHRLERRIRLEIRPDGSQAMHRSSSYYGQFASIARGEY